MPLLVYSPCERMFLSSHVLLCFGAQWCSNNCHKLMMNMKSLYILYREVAPTARERTLGSLFDSDRYVCAFAVVLTYAGQCLRAGEIALLGNCSNMFRHAQYLSAH